MKKKYLINSFYFQKQLFETYLSDMFEFTFSPDVYETRMRAMRYVPKNFLYLKNMYRSGVIDAFDVVHYNRPEALLAFQKKDRQVSVFEVHGFDVGILANRYLRDLHSTPKKIVGSVLDMLIRGTIKKKVREVDVFYCSTPDLVDPLTFWFGRQPIWLPNPIDTTLFDPNGPILLLEGSPACFLAARLHGDKKPEVAIDIFQNYIKPQFPDATLHLIDTGEEAQKYRHKLIDKTTYFWHNFMDKDTLAKKIRGADLVFGDFSIGALSLLPLQVMSLRKPIVTLDIFEIIKKNISELPAYAVRLLSDSIFRDAEVEKNYTYVLDVHDAKKVSFTHLKHIQPYLSLYEKK